MDIDDILAEFDSTYKPPSTRDIEILTQSWISERASPEILPYQEGVLARVMERIREQISVIEEQTGNMDPKANFQLVIIQTELERVKFLVRSYLRIRIQKIDKHALHTLSSPIVRSRLSVSELSYLKTHQALLNNLYLSSFLRNFPESLRRLDDTAGGISMIEEPDLESAVFVRVLRDCEVEIAPASTGGGEDDEEEDEGEERQFKAGELYILRYSAVQDAVVRGDLELI